MIGEFIATGTSITTAITDLFTGIAAIPILVYISRIKTENTKEKTLWQTLFTLLCVSSFIGFIAHFFKWSEQAAFWIWVLLYPILFETTRAFFGLAIQICRPNDPKFCKLPRLVLIPEVCCIVAACTTEILVFVVFGTLLCIFGFALFIVKAIKEKSTAARVLLLALLPQIIGGAYQLVRAGDFTLIWTFDYNSIYHLCLLVSMFVFFASAKISLRSDSTAGNL